MVNFCACVGCSNRGDKNKDKSFYRLPTVIVHQGEQTKALSEQRQREWLAAIRRLDIKPENFKFTRVCSDHFIYGKPSQLYDNTNPDWVPSLKLGHSEASCGDRNRYGRAKEREAKRRRLEDEPQHNEKEDVCAGIAVQTDFTGKKFTELESELHHLRGQVDILSSAKTKDTLSKESFETNDSLVNFYSGLPNWDVFSTVFEFVKGDLLTNSLLQPFHQLTMTLMRLRLNLSGQDLGYRFGVHMSTISRIFSHTIEVLYMKLKPLIIWPDRDTMLYTMPMCYRKHCPTCSVVIDCFEVFLDNLLARAQTYSSYKHHNTVKYLIGITPQGTVSFISRGWGGRVSDKHLTENSNLLNHLIPGDTVLADRGFDIKESAAMYCARVTLPSFTRGKKQLTGIEVEQTRRIANVRIHVERVIGLIRQKYSLLSDTQPIDYVMSKDGDIPLLYKIVTVCCALINFCDSVVPFD